MLRINLFDLLLIPCLLPACGIFTFPDLVNLNRFLAELLVLSFGMVTDLYIF